MNPSYFGPSRRPLFGIYHPPAGRPARSRGVVLCAPLHQEGLRAHRALRQLALLLGRARYHVLRFDYSGCGDSAGDSTDGDTAQWLTDVAAAVGELKDTAGVGRVSLVGLRYGATLAALAARGRRDLDCLVLWDPVVSGADYLREQEDMHRELMREEAPDRLDRLDRLRAAARLPPERDGELLGFPLTARLRRELLALDLTAVSDYPVRRVVLVTSAERADQERLRRRLLALGAPLTATHVPAAWNSDAAMNHSLVPMDLLQAIVAQLAEATS